MPIPNPPTDFVRGSGGYVSPSTTSSLSFLTSYCKDLTKCGTRCYRKVSRNVQYRWAEYPACSSKLAASITFTSMCKTGCGDPVTVSEWLVIFNALTGGRPGYPIWSEAATTSSGACA